MRIEKEYLTPKDLGNVNHAIIRKTSSVLKFRPENAVLVVKSRGALYKTNALYHKNTGEMHISLEFKKTTPENIAEEVKGAPVEKTQKLCEFANLQSLCFQISCKHNNKDICLINKGEMGNLKLEREAFNTSLDVGLLPWGNLIQKTCYE